jgi:hypothetical protein
MQHMLSPGGSSINTAVLQPARCLGQTESIMKSKFGTGLVVWEHPVDAEMVFGNILLMLKINALDRVR